MNINPKVVDISHWQQPYSYAQANAHGFRGIIHKVTEGGAIVDPRWASRWKAILDAGLLLGGYHFIRPGDMRHQAQRFVDEADPGPNTLMALDHEDRNVSLGSAITFMQAVEAEIGRDVVLYSGFLINEQIGGATHEQLAYLKTKRLWLASYRAQPHWPMHVWPHPWLWQYTGDGAGPGPHNVAGIGNRIDVNSFAGSDAELAAQWAGAPIVEAAA
jgi:GH25 family lysozyme M1 (1,4-beta-N-acetylmuramidase)